MCFFHPGRFVVVGVLFSFFLTAAGAVGSGASRPKDGVFYYRIYQDALALKTQGRFDAAAERLKAVGSPSIDGLPKEGLCCLALSALVEWDRGKISEGLRICSILLNGSWGKNFPLLHCDVEIFSNVMNRYMEGIRLRNEGKFKLSIEILEDVIKLAQGICVVDYEVKLLRQASISYWYLGDFDKFLAYNQKAIPLAKQINNIRELGMCLNNIGVYNLRTKDYSGALKYFDEAIRTLGLINEQAEITNCILNIGMVYLELGSFENAENYFTQGLEFDKASGDEFKVSYDYLNLGLMKYKDFQVNRRRPLIEEGIRYLEKGLEILLREGAPGSALINVYINLGVSYYQAGDIEKAGRFLRAAARQAEARNIIENLNCIDLDLGDVSLAGGANIQARAYYLKVIKNASPVTEFNLLIDAYCGLGSSCEADGDYQGALSAYYESLSLLEKARSRISLDVYKTGFSRDKLAPYQKAMNVLFTLYLNGKSTGGLDQIMSLIERTKARAFFESLSEARAVPPPTSRGTQSFRIKNIARDISETVNKLAAPGLSEARKKELENLLGMKEEEYLRILTAERFGAREGTAAAPGEWSIDRLRWDVLDDKTAFLEFFLGERRSFALLVTRRAAVVRELPARGEIEESVRIYLRMISLPTSDIAMTLSAAARMGDQLTGLVPDIAKDGIENLLIVPDGILHHLPFESLAYERAGRRRYLIEDFGIYYAPSAAAFALIKGYPHRSSWARSLLAFGCPDYSRLNAGPAKKSRDLTDAWREVYAQDGFHFLPLPYSRSEVKDIAGYFDRGRADVLTGADANEYALKTKSLRDYQILHFACHSLLDEKNPLRSALLISPSPERGEDGFFQAREIYGLDISADLVVLSACQSGYGPLEACEGSMGLPRLFFYAGTRSVLSALWYIGDRTAARFMKDFYRELCLGRSKSTALRSAKLKMIGSKRLSHPFYWAAYVLSGDPSAVFPAQ